MSLVIKDTLVRRVITPSKLIYRSEIYKIIDIHPKFIVKGFVVKTVNNRMDIITVSAPHPNVNPTTKHLCIPHRIRDLPLTDNTIIMIETILDCFNLDDCYFTPWDEIQYTKVR
jgi:hypothetical protein